MTPEYLRELADMADPEQLWRLCGLDQMKLPPQKQKQLDAGVALRRYAQHIADVETAYGQGKTLAITKLGGSTYAVRLIEPPPEHQRLIERRADHLHRKLPPS